MKVLKFDTRFDTFHTEMSLNEFTEFWP